MADLGSTIGNFIGNTVNPLLGQNQSTTTSTKPSSGSQVTTVIILVVIVGFMGFIVYSIIKSK